MAAAVPPALAEAEDDALVDVAAFQLAVGLGGLRHGHGFVRAQAEPAIGQQGDRLIQGAGSTVVGGLGGRDAEVRGGRVSDFGSGMGAAGLRQVPSGAACGTGPRWLTSENVPEQQAKDPPYSVRIEVQIPSVPRYAHADVLPSPESMFTFGSDSCSDCWACMGSR